MRLASGLVMDGTYRRYENNIFNFDDHPIGKINNYTSQSSYVFIK